MKTSRLTHVSGLNYERGASPASVKCLKKKSERIETFQLLVERFRWEQWL